MESLSLAIELISGMDDFEEVDGETPECVTILEGMETKYSVREMLIGRISAYIQQFRELWYEERFLACYFVSLFAPGMVKPSRSLLNSRSWMESSTGKPSGNG